MAILLLIAMVLAASLFDIPASSTRVREETLRFTIVKRTTRYVVAKRLQEQVVVWKGQRYVVRHGVTRFVVVRLTHKYAYLQRVPVEQPTPVNVNVADYGTHADGTTDDIQHISDAITAARGGEVYFPEGTYKLSTRLVVPDGTTFVGAGMSTVHLKGPLTFGDNSSFSDMKIGEGGTATVGKEDAADTSFARCQFRGGGGDYETTHDFAVLYLGGSTNHLLFEDCNIEANLGTGGVHEDWFDNVWCNPDVTGNSVHDILFKGCHFGVSNGLITGGPLFNVEIFEDNTARTRTSGFRNFNFENCIFEACHSANIDYSGSTLSSDNVTPNSGYSHITGCTFKGNGTGENPPWAGDITVEKGAGYITVTGSTFYRGDLASFASVDTVGGYNTFSNNVIDASDNVLDTGITHHWQGYVHLHSNHNVVTGNTITSTGPQPHAIDVSGDDNIITGNTLTGGNIMEGGSRNVTEPTTSIEDCANYRIARSRAAGPWCFSVLPALSPQQRGTAAGTGARHAGRFTLGCTDDIARRGRCRHAR